MQCVNGSEVQLFLDQRETPAKPTMADVTRFVADPARHEHVTAVRASDWTRTGSRVMVSHSRLALLHNK